MAPEVAAPGTKCTEHCTEAPSAESNSKSDSKSTSECGSNGCIRIQRGRPPGKRTRTANLQDNTQHTFLVECAAASPLPRFRLRAKQQSSSYPSDHG